MTLDSRSREILDRLGPGEIEELALLALDMAYAVDVSLPDMAHRAHVMGVLSGAAPTFADSVRRILKKAGTTRGRIAGEPLRRGRTPGAVSPDAGRGEQAVSRHRPAG